MQQGIEDSNANLPEGERIPFRVGINVEDVVVDEGDMLGDGVNVASRLEELSAPGEIQVSASVRERVGEKLPIAFAKLGLQSVKNVARPVSVHRVETHVEASAAASDDRLNCPFGTAAQRELFLECLRKASLPPQ